MRRGMGIVVLLLVIVGAIAIGVGAYNAGVHQGLEEAGRAGEVVRVIGPGYGYGYGHGFFPFGLFLFPLFLIGIVFLVRGLFWRRHWDGPDHGHWGPGSWKGGPPRFEEWHRRQHEEGEGAPPRSGGEPESA
jgi:hypothetical protein